jgi:TonB family protein
VVLLTFFTIIAVERPAHAEDLCSYTIDDFYLISFGATKGLAQYQVGLSSEVRGPVAMRFSVVENGATSSRTVYASMVDFESRPRFTLDAKKNPTPSGKIVFAWPTKDVSAIAIGQVYFPNSGGRGLECNTTWTPLTRAGFMQTDWQFDDRAVKFGPAVMGSVVTVPKFLHQVQPQYPEKAKERGSQGEVTVAVILDESGKLIDGWVIKSSGAALLDDEALTAAKASTYDAPTSEGHRIAGVFTIEYSFTMTR